jgi:restriction system protein
MTKKSNYVFAESKPNSMNSWVNQVWCFSRKINKGDRVITYF